MCRVIFLSHFLYLVSVIFFEFLEFLEFLEFSIVFKGCLPHNTNISHGSLRGNLSSLTCFTVHGIPPGHVDYSMDGRNSISVSVWIKAPFTSSFPIW
jgi:hypothetical protein